MVYEQSNSLDGKEKFNRSSHYDDLERFYDNFKHGIQMSREYQRIFLFKMLDESKIYYSEPKNPYDMGFLVPNRYGPYRLMKYDEPFRHLDKYKVPCAFPMVISSDFRVGQHRDDDHEEDAPYFKKIFKIILWVQEFSSQEPYR